jgi:hypothetical protein
MNDRLEFPTFVAAQNAADRIHAKMIQVDADYAASVQAGHTTAWAIPYQDETTGQWCVNVKDRGRKATEPGDQAKLKEILKAVVAGETVRPKV